MGPRIPRELFRKEKVVRDILNMKKGESTMKTRNLKVRVTRISRTASLAAKAYWEMAF